MADTTVTVRPAGTAWGAVLGGWVATIGASVIFAPFVAGPILALDPSRRTDTQNAIPAVLGVLLAYVVGGYVGGRMAGYRTSWHGLMTAFFSLFILLLGALVAGAAERGVFAGSGVSSLKDVFPSLDLQRLDSSGDVLTFGAMLAFLAAIIGGWLGGVLAPSQAVMPVAPSGRETAPRARPEAVERERTAARQPAARVLPAAGMKGGERAGEPDAPRDGDSARATRADRPQGT